MWRQYARQLTLLSKCRRVPELLIPRKIASRFGVHEMAIVPRTSDHLKFEPVHVQSRGHKRPRYQHGAFGHQDWNPASYRTLKGTEDPSGVEVGIFRMVCDGCNLLVDANISHAVFRKGVLNIVHWPTPISLKRRFQNADTDRPRIRIRLWVLLRAGSCYILFCSSTMSEAPTLTPKSSPQHAANGGTPSQSSVPDKHQSPPGKAIRTTDSNSTVSILY